MERTGRHAQVYTLSRETLPRPKLRAELQQGRILFECAVIFHGRNLPSVNKLHELHSKRPSNQAWVFFLLESPAHSPDTSQYDGLFNWTMNYRRDSDIYHLHGFFAPLDADDRKAEVSTDYSLGKDKLIVWTVRNCAGKRFFYVNKLKQFVKVDMCGRRESNSSPRRGGDITEDCVKTRNALIT